MRHVLEPLECMIIVSPKECPAGVARAAAEGALAAHAGAPAHGAVLAHAARPER